MSWIEAFLWTIGLELPIYALVLWRRLGLLPFLVVAIGGSALTHPWVWRFVPILEIELDSYDHAVWIMEAFAVTAEAALAAVVLWRCRSPHPLLRGSLASLAANGFSWWLGTYITSWFTH